MFFLIQAPHCQNIKYKIRTIAFYNVENLFDTINNPDTFDDDFTKTGRNHYSSTIYWNKIKNTSEVISQIGLAKSKTSPAIIGLAEVENRNVLEDLINTTALKKSRYQIVHFDSPDLRGIDVALLYQEKYFNLISSEKIEVKLWEESGKRLYTRDILMVHGLLDGEQVFIIVNHWPSRRGGTIRSNSKRLKAAYTTQQVMQQIKQENSNAKIIVMGDFNDDPVDKSIKEGLQTFGNQKKIKENSLFNPMDNMFRNGLNTLGYRDGLNLFDQIIVSANFLNIGKDDTSFEFYKSGIFNPQYLIASKGKYKGYPLRSFQNGNYIDGFSDHFPVYIYLIKKE